jgi:hypothetical protein
VRATVCSFCITFPLLAYKYRHTAVTETNRAIPELPSSAEIDHQLRRGIALAAAGAYNEPDELGFVGSVWTVRVANSAGN